MTVFAVLMRLREICCDPRLVANNWTGSSAKLDACLELVTEAVAGGHRILLFSQFTSMLELLAKRLDEAGVSHFTLQGSTPKPVRAEQVRRVQSGRGGRLSYLAAGGRHGSEPDRRRYRHPLRPVVEPLPRRIRPPTAPTASASATRCRCTG